MSFAAVEPGSSSTLPAAGAPTLGDAPLPFSDAGARRGLEHLQQRGGSAGTLIETPPVSCNLEDQLKAWRKEFEQRKSAKLIDTARLGTGSSSVVSSGCGATPGFLATKEFEQRKSA